MKKIIIEKEVSLMEYIGERAKILRAEAKLSQADMTRKIPKLSQATISQIESASYDNITISTLDKLCDALNCKSSDLLPF